MVAFLEVGIIYICFIQHHLHEDNNAWESNFHHTIFVFPNFIVGRC